jgi:glutaredoxin
MRTALALRPPIKVAPWLTFVAMLATCVGACRPSAALSPQEMDQFQTQCAALIATGKRPERSQDVGFRPVRVPRGTPVVVYGASWCPGCATTVAYLAHRDIPFVLRDVDDDADARAAWRAAAADAGLARPTTMPWVDVRGTVTRGFSPCIIESAWADP